MSDASEKFPGCTFVAHLVGDIVTNRRGTKMTFVVPYDRREDADPMKNMLDRPVLVTVAAWEPFGSDDDE